MNHLISYMRFSFPIILLLTFGFAAEPLLAGDVVKMDPGLMGPGKGVIQQQPKAMNFPPGSIKKMPPAGQQKSGGLNLPSTWDYIHGFGRAGAEALGTVRGWRRGGGRTWRSGPSRGWTQQYGDPDAQYVYPEEYVTPEYQPSPLPSNTLPSAVPRLAPNALPGQARMHGQIKPIDKDFLNFRGGAIINPADSESELNYMLDRRSYTLPPGHYQDLGIGRQWVIKFDRGGPFGAAKYSIGGVKHSFTPTEKGWELFRE